MYRRQLDKVHWLGGATTLINPLEEVRLTPSLAYSPPTGWQAYGPVYRTAWTAAISLLLLANGGEVHVAAGLARTKRAGVWGG